MKSLSMLVMGLLLPFSYGCRPGDTSLLLQVGVAPGASAPSTLAVSVFSPNEALTLKHPVSPGQLPGQLLLAGLPARDQPLLLVFLDGNGPRGVVRTMIRAQHRATDSVSLVAFLRDRDGDGVPDEVDDCPTVPDPLQRRISPDGPGEACQTLDLGGACAAIFCDDFESDTITNNQIVRQGQTDWLLTAQPPYANAVIDTATGAQGTGRSLRLAAKPGLSDGGLPDMYYSIIANATLGGVPGVAPALHSHSFVRMFVRLDNAPDTSGYLRRIANVKFADDTLSLYALPTGIGWEQSRDAKFLNPQSTTMPVQSLDWVGGWSCIEWENQVDTSGAYQSNVWINESPAGTFTSAGASSSFPTSLTLGLEVDFRAETPPPDYVMSLDQVIFDSQRIGCTP
jgi:hypothetical protein